MKRANIRDLHLRTGALVGEAARGHVIVILRRGAAVAELRPIGSSRRPKGFLDRAKFLAQFPPVPGDSGKFLEEDRS